MATKKPSAPNKAFNPEKWYWVAVSVSNGAVLEYSFAASEVRSKSAVLDKGLSIAEVKKLYRFQKVSILPAIK